METNLPGLSQIIIYLNDFPSRISIALIILFFCFIFLLVFYAFLAYKRLQFLFNRARNKYWEGVITAILTDFLSYAEVDAVEDSVNRVFTEFEKIPLKRLFIKEILHRQLLDFHNSFTGNSAERLRQLFLKLELDQLTERKLHAGKEDIKIQGIIETAKIQLHRFIPIITQLIHSKSAEVRVEAQATYIILHKQHSFQFLEHVKEPILDWHQLILMELTHHIPTKELPDFSTWLNSKNSTVVELCIKLVGHYQQFQAVDKLIVLLKHPETKIKLLAVRVLGDFEASEAEESLLELYASGAVEIRAAVIKALGRIRSGNQMDFLLKEANSNEFDIVYHSLDALRNHGEPGLGMIKQYLPKAPQMNKEIIQHVLYTQNHN